MGSKWMRRVRGALGMGLIWALAWSAVGLLPRLVLGFNPDAPFPIIFGVFGFIAGVTFSALVIVADGRRSFDQVSVRRFAGWGALGGFLLSAIFARLASLSGSDVLAVVPTFAIAGAISASGSLALARRARNQELADGGDTALAELTDAPKRNSIGR